MITMDILDQYIDTTIILSYLYQYDSLYQYIQSNITNPLFIIGFITFIITLIFVFQFFCMPYKRIYHIDEIVYYEIII